MAERAAVTARRCGLLLACAAASAPAAAKVFLTQEQALAFAFGEQARTEREVHFLSDAEVERARRLAGAETELHGGLVIRYRAFRDDRLLGTAYFDTHRVRTLQETVMIVVTPEGRIGRIEILAFGEPPEYLPRQGWLAQFEGRELDENLALKRGVHAVTGATLTAEAITRAARRVLAFHQVIEAKALARANFGGASQPSPGLAGAGGAARGGSRP